MTVFPVWVGVVLGVIVAAIDFTQTQTFVALSPEAKFGVGLASAICGFLFAFQRQTVSVVRRLRGRP